MHTLHSKINWKRENTKIAFAIDQADTGTFHIEGKQPLPPFFFCQHLFNEKIKGICIVCPFSNFYIFENGCIHIDMYYDYIFI